MDQERKKYNVDVKWIGDLIIS